MLVVMPRHDGAPARLMLLSEAQRGEAASMLRIFRRGRFHYHAICLSA